jgi:hypothetical protein
MFSGKNYCGKRIWGNTAPCTRTGKAHQRCQWHSRLKLTSLFFPRICVGSYYELNLVSLNKLWGYGCTRVVSTVVYTAVPRGSWEDRKTFDSLNNSASHQSRWSERDLDMVVLCLYVVTHSIFWWFPIISIQYPRTIVFSCHANVCFSAWFSM